MHKMRKVRKEKKLVDVAKTIRSKNAGPDKITFDIIFNEKKSYEMVKNSKIINKKKISELFGIEENRITDLVEFDPANAIKFTISRRYPSGSPGESDTFGSQQYPPLYNIKVPIQ